MKNKNSLYLTLTILLVILSTIGGYFLFKMYQDSNLVTYTSSTIPKIDLLPTDSIEEPEQIAPDSTTTTETTATSSSIANTTITTITSITPSISPVVTITPKTTITTISKLTTSTPISTKSSVVSKDVIPYQNTKDKFSVSYNVQRQLHQDTEASGNRYTFVNKLGNFAIHVSSGDKWSWSGDGRQFDNSLLISGQPTYRFDNKAKTQTIIDLQSTDKNYTIQCVHNGLESLKDECDQFISSFKLL